MKRFAGLSLVPASESVARVSLLFGFFFSIVGVLSLVAIMTTHCTVHMSVAWRRVDLSRSTFQSSNPIGQYIIHAYIRIRIALTTP